MLLIAASLNAYSQEPANCNCCSENHKSFDFWLGEWQVENKTGTEAGVSSIIKSQGNCVILEKWISAEGKYTGMSSNFYNPETDKWEQVWIDNQGQILKLSGKFEDNKMVLSSEATIDKDGNQSINKITWFNNPDGTVRQLWEVVKSNGRVLVAFDGIYTKKSNDN